MYIALDMDDVIVDFCGGLVDAVNREYDAGLTIDDISQWELRPLLDPILGESWWKWMRKRSWLWSNFEAIPGAIGSIERLRQEGHYLEVVTSKPAWAEANVWQWLGKWKPPVNRVTITDPDAYKSEATNADVLVDDKLENVRDFARTGRYGLLFTRPHNRQRYSGTPLVTRVNGWPQVMEWVRDRT